MSKQKNAVITNEYAQRVPQSNKGSWYVLCQGHWL